MTNFSKFHLILWLLTLLSQTTTMSSLVVEDVVDFLFHLTTYEHSIKESGDFFGGWPLPIWSPLISLEVTSLVEVEINLF